MGATSSLSTAFGALRRNPVLFAAAFLTALLGGLGILGQAGGVGASIGLSLLSILLTPFVTGGILGMAEEAVGGRTRLDTFLRAGRENYLSLLGAMVLLFLVFLGVGVLFAVAAFAVAAVGVFGLAGGPGAGGLVGPGLGLGAAVLGLLFLLAVLALAFLLQFFDVAVVVDDAGAVGSLKRSARFVRGNPLAALGFLAVYVLLSALGSIPGLWLSFRSAGRAGPPIAPGPMAGPTMAGPTAAELMPVFLASVAVSTLTAAFLYTYKVAVYADGAKAPRRDEANDFSDDLV